MTLWARRIGANRTTHPPERCGCGIIEFVTKTSSFTRGLSLIVIVLALTAASCRGTTSEQKEEPAGASAAPTATPLLSLDWTDADLEKNVAQVGYGPKPKGILARGADGSLVFTPETAKDHVATNFMALQPYDGERSLDVVLDAKVPGGPTCEVFLQDQGYNLIGTVPCKTSGEQKGTAKVPGNVTGVRVYFLSATREPVRIPARIRLIEHR